MTDKGKIADEKKLLEHLDGLLKDMPKANSFLQDFQNAMGTLKPSMIDRAALEWERSILQNQIDKDEIEVKRQENTNVALAVQAQEQQQLNNKERGLFDDLMKRDVLHVEDFNKAISIFDNHPKSLEAVDLAAKFMDSGNEKTKEEIEKRRRTDPKFDSIWRGVENRDQFFKDYYDLSKREDLRRQHPDAVKVMDNLSENESKQFKQDVNMSNKGDNKPLHKHQAEFDKNHKKDGELILESVRSDSDVKNYQASNKQQSYDESLHDLVPKSNDTTVQIALPKNFPGLDGIKLAEAKTIINSSLVSNTKTSSKSNNDRSV